MQRSRALALRVLPAILFIAAALLPMFAPTYYVQLSTKVLLMGLAAMGLNLAVGYGGLISLCHAAFFGLAGYVLALTAPSAEAPSLWLTLPAAVGAVTVAAAIIGALSLRTRGMYFIMVTLAFGEMLYFLFSDTGIGGGSDGIYVYFKPTVSIAGWTLLNLEKPAVFYLVVLGLVLLGILFLRAVVHSHFGHALTAARDNETRARSLGFPVYRVRLIAFTLSGAIVGVAGYFAAAQYGYVAPTSLGWHVSALLLVMVVLGGTRSVAAPLIGAIILLGLEEVLESTISNWKLVEGIIIILIVLVKPESLRQLASYVRRGDASPPARSPSIKLPAGPGELRNV